MRNNYITVKINKKKCTKCFDCIRACPTKALTLERGIFMHNAYECSYCYKCMEQCENKAIKIMDM